MYEIDPASVFSSIVSPITKLDGSQVSDRCPLGYLLLAQLSRRLIGELMKVSVIRPSSVRRPSVNIFKRHLL